MESWAACLFTSGVDQYMERSAITGLSEVTLVDGIGHVQAPPGAGFELYGGAGYLSFLGHVGEGYTRGLLTGVLYQHPRLEGARAVRTGGALGEVPGELRLVDPDGVVGGLPVHLGG